MEVVLSKYYKSLNGDVKERYDEKIQKCCCDPYAIKIKELSVNPNDFPEITILDIGEYLVHSISSFTKKKFSAYKSTDAYRNFESGFVLNIGSKKYNEYAVIRGRVKHGQRINEKALEVWVLAKMNGKIDCSHCTCIAGLTETCSNVGSICYAVSSLWESGEMKSVTDFLCKWNEPNFKKVSMTFASNIQWKPHSEEKPTLESSFLKNCKSLSSFDDESMDAFVKGCCSDGNICGVASYIFPEQRRNTTIKDKVFLASLFSNNNIRKSRRELIDIGKSIVIELSTDEVNQISCLTLPRLKSKCRFALKRGRIITSNFKDCCYEDIHDPSISLINRIINPMTNFTPYPKHITKKKKKAFEGYDRSMDVLHREFERYECGLVINPKLPYFAASPDGLITCDCHGEGCIVIKFMKIMESAESFEVLTRKPNQILKINENGDYCLEETHDLYYQIQFHINVVELKYCDVIFWSPKSNLNHLVIRVEGDVNFWILNLEKAKKFHEQVVIPEILGKSFSMPDSSGNGKKTIKHETRDEKKDVFIDETSTSSSQYEEDKKQEDTLLTNLFTETEIEIVDINERNLMTHTTDEILNTFFDHENELQRLYDELTLQSKRNYRPRDLQPLIEYDIVNEEQLKAMATFAEKKLIRDLEKEHNSTDVIFDAILPEWALATLCRKLSFTRSETLKILRIQGSVDMYLTD